MPPNAKQCLEPVANSNVCVHGVLIYTTSRVDIRLPSRRDLHLLRAPQVTTCTMNVVPGTMHTSSRRPYSMLLMSSMYSFPAPDSWCQWHRRPVWPVVSTARYFPECFRITYRPWTYHRHQHDVVLGTRFFLVLRTTYYILLQQHTFDAASSWRGVLATGRLW